ncbi:MAG TPA: hypothetical protein VF456_20285 [Vicinamibacterales bacterium]
MAAKTLQQAVTEYQQKNPTYSAATWQGIVPYLNSQGFNVAYATHANNSVASSDAIVDASSGKAYDLAIDGGNGGWSFQDTGTYDPSRSVVVNGKFTPYNDWAKQYQTTSSTTTGSPGTGATTTGTTTQPSQSGGATYPQAPVQGGGGPTNAVLNKVRFNLNQARYITSVVQPAAAANAASAAAMRARATAMRGGRRSTIIGVNTAPSTAPASVLGSTSGY